MPRYRRISQREAGMRRIGGAEVERVPRQSVAKPLFQPVHRTR